MSLAFPKPKKKEKPKTYSSIKRKTYEEIKRQEAEKRTRKIKEQAVKKAVKSVKKTNVKPKKAIKQKAYKPVCAYWSIFTTDLDRCYITGSTKSEADIHIHHVFGAANKHNSERRGFIVPLRADWHDMADYGVHGKNKELDLKLKRACQEYYLEHYGTKEEFIAEFGKWW